MAMSNVPVVFILLLLITFCSTVDVKRTKPFLMDGSLFIFTIRY